MKVEQTREQLARSVARAHAWSESKKAKARQAQIDRRGKPFAKLGDLFATKVSPPAPKSEPMSPKSRVVFSAGPNTTREEFKMRAHKIGL